MRSISQLKINTNKQGNKNASSIQPLEYNNSFTRLFIGETDEKAIRERYLSNMIVKKHKQLHLFISSCKLLLIFSQLSYFDNDWAFSKFLSIFIVYIFILVSKVKQGNFLKSVS